MSRLALALWRGERPLRLTFWFYGIGGWILIFAIIATLVIVLNSFTWIPIWWPRISLAITIVLMTMPTVYGLAISVAVWRSASRYAGYPIFALLAKVFAAITVVYLVYQAPTFSYSSKSFIAPKRDCTTPVCAT
jgi:hypothetical protein